MRSARSDEIANGFEIIDIDTFRRNSLELIWYDNRPSPPPLPSSFSSPYGDQIIIFLYLLDNETSWMIILSSGVGVLIELWKITKAFSVTIDRNGPFPFISLKDKAGYTETATKKHDREAITYLSYVLYPLVSWNSS